MNKIKTVFTNKSGEIVGKIEELSGEYVPYFRIPSEYGIANSYVKIGKYNSFEVAKENLNNCLDEKIDVNYDKKYLLLLFSVLTLILSLGLCKFI